MCGNSAEFFFGRVFDGISRLSRHDRPRSQSARAPVFGYIGLRLHAHLRRPSSPCTLFLKRCQSRIATIRARQEDVYKPFWERHSRRRQFARPASRIGDRNSPNLSLKSKATTARISRFGGRCSRTSRSRARRWFSTQFSRDVGLEPAGAAFSYRPDDVVYGGSRRRI